MKLFQRILSLALLACLLVPAGLAEAEMTPAPLKRVTTAPGDEGYYQDVIDTEMYNLKVIRDIPSAFEQEGFEAFLSAANMLAKMDASDLSDGQKGTLDKLTGLQDALVQVKGYDEVVWPIWGDDIPCHEDAEALEFTAQSYDNSDFIPYITPYLLDDPASAKANLIIVAGGGYSSRNNKGEGFPVAAGFNERGYNCFLLQRRVQPYCAEDIWMDMQRAIRYVRYHGESLGLGGLDNIVATGFSGGSATVIGAMEHLYGDIQPTVYDASYVPDEVDAVSSDLDVAFLIYGPNPAPTHDAPYEGFVSDNENLPACFIAAGAIDPTGAPDDNWTLYKSIFDKTMCEIHTFATVAHGFGVGFEGTNSAYWMDMADRFVDLNTAAREKAARKAAKEAAKKSK